MPADLRVQLKNPTALRYFYEVAQARSFRGAAERTHVAASAINRHVKNLESELGVQLFERQRGRNGLRLTDAGEVYLQHVMRAMSELSAARTALDELRGLQRGTITLGATAGVARELLPQLIESFHVDYPHIDYRVEVAPSLHLLDLLLSDAIDFALTFNPPVRAGLSVIARREIGSCVMMHKNHPLARKRSIRLDECQPYPLVMPDESLALRATLDEMFTRVGLRPRAVVTTNSYELMRTAAASGMGVAVLTQFLSGQDPHYPLAVFVPVRDDRVAPQSLIACVRTGRHLSAATAAFADKVGELLRRPRLENWR